jgi:Predicted pPIWI-associating nuclease
MADEKDLSARDAKRPETERERRARRTSVADITSMVEPTLAFYRELSILRDFQPLALNLRTAQFALDMYKPMLSHLDHFQKLFQSSTLLAHKNLTDPLSQAVLAWPTLRITQDAAQTAAWASMLAKATTPSAPLLANLTAGVTALSLDLSKHIAMNATMLASVRFVMPVAAFGSAAEAVKLSDWMSGPMASALASFRRTSLAPRELAPAAFATVTGAGVTGAVFPAGSYDKPDEVTALETEVHAAGIELVRRHHPAIARKLDGARFALQGGNPDAASQAANSLVEAIDQLLRRLTQGGDVLAWCKSNYPAGVYEKNGHEAPTRTGRIMYLANAGGVSTGIGKGIATILTTGVVMLQQAKHGDSPEDLVRNYVLIVEGCVGAAVSMSLKARL